jgi:hypothetical protein
MGILRVMSQRGDDRVVWSTQRDSQGRAPWDPEVGAAIREAERIFREQQEQGAAAFRVAKGQSPVRIDEFNPDAEQIVLVPRVVGG